jgi:hypothetical protein
MRSIARKAVHSVYVLAVLFCCDTAVLAGSDGEERAPQEASPARSNAAPKRSESPWLLEAKIKTYVNSHTSYEFGDPMPPYPTPLSRLEFPLDYSVWGGLEVRRNFSRFSAGVEFLTSLSDQETGRFKDSDWADDAGPSRLTNYGETDTRLKPSYQVRADLDVQVADLLGLPAPFELRPVVGFRWQRFSLLAHDGVQYDYDTPGAPPVVVPLPGPGIAFEQNWYQYFVGVKFGYDWGAQFGLQRLKLRTQLDWAYTEGKNEDRHLLRAGDRVTREDTTGNAWHALVELVAGLTSSLDLGLEVDYLRIRTTGDHELQSSELSMSWSNGVKAWSEQLSFMLKLGYRF